MVFKQIKPEFLYFKGPKYVIIMGIRGKKEVLISKIVPIFKMNRHIFKLTLTNQF